MTFSVGCFGKLAAAVRGAVAPGAVADSNNRREDLTDERNPTATRHLHGAVPRYR
jgi:hypothetical protein